jgi:hypothetical protein
MTQAHSEDRKKLQDRVKAIVRGPWAALVPPQHERGFKNEVSGAFLCPIDMDWSLQR